MVCRPQAKYQSRRGATGNLNVGISFMLLACLVFHVPKAGADIICTTLWDPVCGCNGRTYGNSCEAFRAGVTCIAYKGVCTAFPDTTPPDTTIIERPELSSGNTDATFSFVSTETGSTFYCQLNGGAWTSCFSPLLYSGLADGSHTFSVKARDAVGNVDPTPALYAWTIVSTPSACTTNQECGAAFYCSKPTGGCSGSGICTSWNPTGNCFTVYDPACGCNGLTYGNTCEAAKAGISIAYTGACGNGVARISQQTFLTIADAYSSISDGSMLQLKSTEWVEDIVFDRPLAIVMKGGCDSDFVICNSMTVIQGSIVVLAGSVTMDNIIVM